MQDESDQQFFDIYLATITNNAYSKPIFVIDDFGRSKTESTIAWEMSIAEDQGFTPVLVYFSRHTNHFIIFSNSTGFTGYFNNYNLEV